MAPLSPILLAAWLALAPDLRSSELAPARPTRRQAPPATVPGSRVGDSAVALLRASRAKDGPSTDEVVARLHGLGAAALEPLLDLLIARRIPPLVEGERLQTLSVPQRDMILATLARWSPRSSLTKIEARLSTENSPAVRLAAIYVYSAVGEARDLARIGQLALGSEPDAAQPAELSEDLASAVRTAHAAILRRDPSGFRWLRAEIDRAPACMQVPVLFAVGDTRDPCGIDVLARVLAFHPQLADMVVAQARLLGRSCDAEANRALAQEVRPYLDNERVELACAAIRSLGELGDDDLAPRLVQLLESDRPAIADSAHWALRRLSRLELPKQAGPWKAWLRSEQDWWANDSERLIVGLTRGSRATRVQSVAALGSRTWRRTELALEVAAALADKDPLVREQACSALGQLGSPVVSEALINALEDETAKVRVAARAALAAIHSRALPEDPAACREALHL